MIDIDPEATFTTGVAAAEHLLEQVTDPSTELV